ncbi:unnamed protein product, partial [Onchocerca flexuosa]|uniref:Transposase n=1 Tax=Onchocerca flexuosa TaxID=387005 RepID=A0A183I6J4_9BILA
MGLVGGFLSKDSRLPLSPVQIDRDGLKVVIYACLTGTKFSKMSRNIETTENILSNGPCENRYSMNTKTFDGRNRLKTITDGVMQPTERQ